MRCGPLIGCQPFGDRPADAEPRPHLLDQVDDAELEAGLDLDRPVTTGRIGHGRAAIGVEHPADAAHEALQRGPVEPVGAAEAVHHLGLDVASLGMADVLGERVVADDRAVRVAALRGSKVHAHVCSMYTMPSRLKPTEFVCLQISALIVALQPEKPNDFNPPVAPTRPKCAH